MQWLILALTCVVMAVLQRLARGAPLEARATMALGFLLLAAHVAGTIAQRVRLPRITGYLFAGLIVGPSWLGLVREPEVAALHVFATGALALIAFGAGLALRLPERRAEQLGVLRIAGSAVIVPFVAVTLVMLSVSPWFPITAHQPFRDALTVSLILGAFAAISSPVITAAVMTERDTPQARTTLNVTVAQDVAALVLMLVVLLVAQPLSSWGATRPGIALDAALHLLGSIAAGGVVAVILARYLKTVVRGLMLVLVALAVLIVLAAVQLGLEPVLMALAAGVVMRLTAPREAEAISAEVRKCAEPVHVVFFALAGAAIQLDVLAELWPWALLLVGLRMAGLRAGVRRAGLRNGWLGLVSQGGLALSLAAVARRAFPEWNVSLEALLVAMIGLYQLAGPICFDWALQRPEIGLEDAHASPHRDLSVEPAVVAGPGHRM